jgi:hypothetical protein
MAIEVTEGKSQTQFIRATLILNIAPTVATILDLYVNNTVIGSLTVAPSSTMGTIVLTNTAVQGDKFSVEFSAVGDAKLVGTLYMESKDIV